MTTPPITRRCPFCGAPAKLTRIISAQRNDRLRAYIVCLNCTARGPENAYDDEWRGIAAAVFDWNTRASISEWSTNGAAIKLSNRRAAYIAKWSRACNGSKG